jgi:hypothetical protein
MTIARTNPLKPPPLRRWGKKERNENQKEVKDELSCLCRGKNTGSL